MRARRGARHAVDAAYRFVARSAVGELDAATGAVAAARRRLEAVAAGAASCAVAPLADLATTLTVAVVSDRDVAVAQVGDGAVVLQHGTSLSVAVAPPRSEYVNETRFVTSATWAADQRTFTGSADGLDGIAVLTDGLQLLAFDMTTFAPHGPFFDPLFAFGAAGDASPRELVAFLDSERVNARTDDDKTLVVAVRCAGD